MRIINPIGGIILLFVLLGTLGCSEDSFQDEAKPVIVLVLFIRRELNWHEFGTVRVFPLL